MKTQLTLRDLFWLVLVCGLAVGWWVDQAQLRTNHRLEMLKSSDVWANSRDDLIRKHQTEKLLLSTQRNEASVLLDIERRKNSGNATP